MVDLLVDNEEDGWDGDIVREIIEKKKANVVVNLLEDGRDSAIVLERE